MFGCLLPDRAPQPWTLLDLAGWLDVVVSLYDISVKLVNVK
jgi:hypothetical protein